MKKIILNFILAVFCFNLNAQTPTYNIVVTQPTNGDTLLMPLLGVISGPLPPPSSPLPDITPQLQDIGVTSIRNNDNYDDKLDMEALFRCPSPNPDTVPCWLCNPNDTVNLHFEASDTLFRAICDGGFSSFFRLGGESQSALSYQHHVFQGPQDTVAENNWIQAAIHVVDHYDNFEGNTNVLEYIDIWTEWPNNIFWQRSDEEFIWFFTKALDTLKHHFPNKKIGGPGFLVPTHMVANGIVNNKATDLLTSLYNHNVRPDFIGWHLWHLSTESYYNAGENFRKLLDGTAPFDSVPWAGTGFFDGVEIICDAYGLPKVEDDGTTLIPESVQYLLNNKQKGSSLLTAQWIAMQETNTVKAYYYRDADPISNPDTTIGNIGTTGLFYGDTAVTYKPQAYAFRLWSKIVNEFPQKLSCDFPVVGSDLSELWVLSSKNNQGAYGLLIANTDSIEKNITIDITGITIDTANFDIFCSFVNDSDNGLLEYPQYSNNFNIPLQTVIFVRILPKNYLQIEETEKTTVKIFPNPTKGIINIENTKNYNIEIFDFTGHSIKKLTNINQDKISIDLSDKAKGIYLIKTWSENANNIKTTKVIIE